MKSRFRPARLLKWALVAMALSISGFWLLSTDWSFKYVSSRTSVELIGGKVVLLRHDLPFPFGRESGWVFEKMELGSAIDVPAWSIEKDYPPGGYVRHSAPAWPLIIGLWGMSFLFWWIDSHSLRNPARVSEMSHSRRRRLGSVMASLLVALLWATSWVGWRLSFDTGSVEFLFAEDGMAGIRVPSGKVVGAAVSSSTKSTVDKGLWGRVRSFFDGIKMEPNIEMSQPWNQRLGLIGPVWGRRLPAMSVQPLPSRVGPLGYIGTSCLTALAAQQVMHEYLVPFWMVFLPLSILTLIIWLRAMRRSPEVCAMCGYSLLHNTSGRCPECGSIVTLAQKQEIPSPFLPQS